MTLIDSPLLWDDTLVRATDPVTSHLAAAIVDKRDSQMVVLRCLARTGPLADHELVTWLQDYDHSPLSESRIRSARSELVNRGLVEFAGIHTKTPRGRMTQVWSVTAAGHHEIENNR